MNVQGVEITEAQTAAGLAAMAGEFKLSTVRSAMIRAGLDGHVADRAADRLLQMERKAGRIRATSNKNWKRV